MSALCEDGPPQGYPTEKTRCRTCPRRYNSSIALQRITDALCEDILTMSDEEVLQELRDQGLDPDEEAAKMRALFEQAVVEADRRREARK